MDSANADYFEKWACSQDQATRSHPWKVASCTSSCPLYLVILAPAGRVRAPCFGLLHSLKDLSQLSGLRHWSNFSPYNQLFKCTVSGTRPAEGLLFDRDPNQSSRPSYFYSFWELTSIPGSLFNMSRLKGQSSIISLPGEVLTLNFLRAS